MAFKINRWKTARGLYYLSFDGSKRTVTKFIKGFLSKIDPVTLKAEQKVIKKRKEDRASFIEGPTVTIIVLGSHVLIKPENEEDCLEVIRELIELPSKSKK